VNADRFRERLEQTLLDNPGEEEWLVLDFEGIGALDATALDVLAELVRTVRRSGLRVVAVARANEAVLTRLGRAGLLEPAGPLRVFPTINSAVRAYRQQRS
jgi:SulP family sulfate permease